MSLSQHNDPEVGGPADSGLLAKQVIKNLNLNIKYDLSFLERHLMSFNEILMC